MDDLLTDVTAGVYRYGVRDDRGVAMDTLKVIGDPAGGYLAVYHSRPRRDAFTVHLARSDDLITWRHHADLDHDASQPTIAALAGQGFLVAVEAGGAGRPAWLRVHHYPTRRALLDARPARTFDAPHTLVPADRYAEGTPHIAYAAPDASVVDLGFHYFRDGVVDRQGAGRLTDLRHWESAADPALDAAVEAWGARGNIGGRDTARVGSEWVTLIEGQLRPRDWGSWRVFRYDRGSGKAWPLAFRTHGGSTAFANPTVTFLQAPTGMDAVVVTLFVFSEGAAPGEAGPLLFYRELKID
ncbi:hypothetical protein GCM10009557_59060 [Virgisporangium ochraceum]|uniref:Uncharacterized protein n=1 Tax=Virgisporangium ochraceum TaxID=65505 RepID=A0A8J3ZQV5_9ACTN|nr:hypothetical protein [Virgisporangium ochraceum]GIJ68809.1 hypothetical protein Voc01_037260 [Virgisporangium ochraceum]